MRSITLSFGCFARISLFIFCSRKDAYSLVIWLDLKNKLLLLIYLIQSTEASKF